MDLVRECQGPERALNTNQRGKAALPGGLMGCWCQPWRGCGPPSAPPEGGSWEQGVPEHSEAGGQAGWDLGTQEDRSLALGMFN